MPRADMEQHLRLECMHRDVQCPYSNLGCVSQVAPTALRGLTQGRPQRGG